MLDEKNFFVDTEQLKNEAKDAVNQVKDTIKNGNFKEETIETKKSIAEIFENSIYLVKKVATGEENVLFKAIAIMILFIATSFVGELIYVIKSGSYREFMENLISLFFSLIHPILFILIPALLVFIMNKENRKSLITIITTLIVAAVPNVINELIDILNIVIVGIREFTSPFTMMFSAIAIILTYFGMKELFGEEYESFIKKYAIIKLLSVFILNLLGESGIY